MDILPLPFHYRAWLHVYDLPDMAVKVLKTMPVHKAEVLRFTVDRSASLDRLAYYLIDFLPALGSQAHKRFSVF